MPTLDQILAAVKYLGMTIWPWPRSYLISQFVLAAGKYLGMTIWPWPRSYQFDFSIRFSYRWSIYFTWTSCYGSFNLHIIPVVALTTVFQGCQTNCILGMKLLQRNIVWQIDCSHISWLQNVPPKYPREQFRFWPLWPWKMGQEHCCHG